MAHRELPPFLRHYIDAAGQYTTPSAFHYWAALSLLATFSSKSLAYEHIVGNPLRPNLFVFLIAKSAAGKGLAITNALRLVSPGLVCRGKEFDPDKPYLFQGRTSSQAMVSRLHRFSKKLADPDEGVEYYFTAPELGASLDLPSGAVGGFVKFMTHAYDNTGQAWSDDTRTHGFVDVPAAFLNWLAGTTPDWLRGSVGEQDFRGGFSGRIVPVYVEERVGFRHRPVLPPDVAELRTYCRAHLQAVRTLQGTFRMDPDAYDRDESFARGRYENLPGDERVHPFYERGATLARKLSMLHSLARSDFDLRITAEDMERAQRDVLLVEADLPKILDLVSETKETRGLELMRSTIEKARRIPRKTMFAHLRRQLGVLRTQVLEYEATLLAEQVIAIDRRTDDYVWIPKGVLRKRETDVEDVE